MKLLRFFTAALVAALACSVSIAQPVVRRNDGSHAAPQEIDWDMEPFTIAAGLAQQTNCPGSPVGMKIGEDATLLWRTGDGNHAQRTLIFHSKVLGIVAAFQGTNGSSLISSLNDYMAVQVDVDYRFKDSVSRGAKVMFGFQDAYLKVADKVSEKIPEFKKQYNETRVSVVGHSLGAAIGLIATAHLEHVVDGGMHRSILFGLPRTGNKIFADWFDKTLGDRFHFVVNGNDPVPHVALRQFGYRQVGNQIWINPANSDHYKLYPGQENVHGYSGQIPDPSGISNHGGIYFHTELEGYNGRCNATYGQD